MGKKKNKKMQSFSDQLASCLREGSAEDLIAEAAGRGIAKEEFIENFDRSRSILTQGSDPRNIVSLLSVFQQAFLKIAERAEDEDMVLDMLSMSTDKETKKEAKGILHRFRSRGINVTLPEDKGSSILERRIIEESPDLACYITTVTSLGSRMVWLATFVRGGVGVYQAEINDTDGLQEFSGSVIGRSRYRELSKDMFSKDRLPISEISYAEARLWISNAVSINRATSHSVPEGYLEASSVLPEPTTTAQLPDPKTIYDAESISDLKNELQKTTELNELPEFSDWVPSQEAIKKLQAKFQEIETSQITINTQQKADQIDKALDQVVIDMLNEEKDRTLYQNRLFEMAVHFSRVNDKERGRLCAAAAWQLSEEEFNPLDSPFFHRLVRKMFKKPEEIAQQMQPPDSPDKPTPDQGDLIVTP